MATDKAVARRRLDERFEALRVVRTVARPHRGWIRAVRDALGMSSSELADRLSVTHQAVSELEKSEERETVQLKTLRRAADALDCDLVYYLLPRGSLDRAVHEQAMKVAATHLSAVDHHSKLESQGVPDSDQAAQLQDLVREFVDSRGLWAADSTPS